MLLMVYGYDGSGPQHWQRWLEAELQVRGVPLLFPELPDVTAPQKDVWVDMLAECVDRSPTPVTFIAHSLGCWAVDHLLHQRGATKIRGALLVAPPTPYLLFEPVETFFPPPQSRMAWAPIAPHSLLAGSDNDDYTSAEEFAEIAAKIGVAFHLVPGAGHINTDSGYGPWPFALEWALAAA